MPIHIEPHQLPIPESLERLLATTPELNRAYIVGGSVRDSLLGLPVKDIDIEVFGQTFETLASALGRSGRVDLVGKSFGVVKWTDRAGVTHDFSLPRRDSKVGAGHKGFAVEMDPGLGLEEATARRDFSINALLFDPRRNCILDCHDGLHDLRTRRLRHTGPAFVEDPLRVLRGMQFASRFDLSIDPETVRISRAMAHTFPELAVERVCEEWMKWAARSVRPSAGLRFLESSGWLQHFPEFARLRGVEQDGEWHPEGDVFEHTCFCCDAMAQLPDWLAAEESRRVIWMLAILCHDFGKATTTRREMRDGRERIISPDHEAAGGPMALEFLGRIGASNDVRERVVPLVVNHLAHLQAGTDRAIRRLSNRLVPENIESLCAVMSADCLGRPPRPAVIAPTISALRERAMAMTLARRPPVPVLLGRHLLELGWSPGREVGLVLREAFEAQLEGEITGLSDAWRWLDRVWDPAWPPAARERLSQRI